MVGAFIACLAAHMVAFKYIGIHFNNTCKDGFD